jgi:hypothetical protein
MHLAWLVQEVENKFSNDKIKREVQAIHKKLED